MNPHVCRVCGATPDDDGLLRASPMGIENPTYRCLGCTPSPRMKYRFILINDQGKSRGEVMVRDDGVIIGYTNFAGYDVQLHYGQWQISHPEKCGAGVQLTGWWRHPITQRFTQKDLGQIRAVKKTMCNPLDVAFNRVTLAPVEVANLSVFRPPQGLGPLFELKDINDGDPDHG